MLDELRFWMTQNKKKKMWHFGMNPPIILAAHQKKWEKFPTTWNREGQ